MQSLPPLPPLRGVAEWRAMGIPVRTTSDEAAKLLDAYFYQMYGMYQASEFGGMEGTFEKLQAADPDFLITKLITLEMKRGRLLSNWAALNKDTADLCADLSNSLSVANDWEKRHIEAMLCKANGQTTKAGHLWEDCLALYPRDMFAGLHMFEISIQHGDPAKMCSTFSQLVNYTPSSDPYFGFFQSRLAFGLTESGRHDVAKKTLNQCLEHTSWDPWAHHTYAHVHDALGEFQEGWERLHSQRQFWKLPDERSALTCHNHWHEALFAWQLDDRAKMLELVDDEVLTRVQKLQPNAVNLLSLADAISIMMRLEMDELLPREELQERWDLIDEVIRRCHSDEGSTGLPFYDLHVAVSLLAGHHSHRFQEFSATLRGQCDEFMNALSGYNTEVDIDRPYVVKCMQHVGYPLLESLTAFMNQDYHEAAEILFTNRRQIYQLGGSNAQRDLFTMILYHSLSRSKTKLNHARLQAMLEEKVLFYQDDSKPLERLQSKLYLNHSGATLE